MTTTNLQEEKASELDEKIIPIPWWVLLYFSGHTVVNQYEDSAQLMGDFMNYTIRYRLQLRCWQITGYLIQYEGEFALPVDSMIFSFPIPPTEEKFRAVMQALDIQ